MEARGQEQTDEEKVEEFVSDVCKSWEHLSKMHVPDEVEDTGILSDLDTT